jgi:hypothetical protein
MDLKSPRFSRPLCKSQKANQKKAVWTQLALLCFLHPFQPHTKNANVGGSKCAQSTICHRKEQMMDSLEKWNESVLKLITQMDKKALHAGDTISHTCLQNVKGVLFSFF